MTSSWRRKLSSELSGVGKFGAVGIIATIIHVLVFSALMEAIEIYATLANFLAFLSALAVSYAGNARWTFIESDATASSLARYITLASGGLALNTLFAFLIVDLASFAYTYALIPMLFITPMVTYIGARNWAFAQHVEIGR